MWSQIYALIFRYVCFFFCVLSVWLFLLKRALLPFLAFRWNYASSVEASKSSARLVFFFCFFLFPPSLLFIVIVLTHHTLCVCQPPSLPPSFLLSAHLLWAVYKSLSLSGGVSIGAVSIRASASLSSLLPPSDWGERERERGGGGSTATLPTHTYTLCLHYTVEAVREHWEVGPQRFYLYIVLFYFDCFMTFFCCCFCFYVRMWYPAW